MNIRVDTTSPIPPYEQLRSQIRVMVTSGALARGTRLPTVRQLAGDLGLAVNTVGRAYKELETERIVETRGRNGTLVLASRSRVDDEEARAASVVFARAAGRAGLSLSEAMQLLRHA